MGKGTMNNDRVVQAFSGSAVAAEAVRALAGRRDVVTLTLDIGQGQDLTGVRERALASGAARAHVLDVREEFARDYFWPSVQSGRIVSAHPGELLVPLLAAKLVEVARIEGAATVAHEWSGSDAGRVADAVERLAPDLEVLAPGAAAGISAADEATLWSSARLRTTAGFELTIDAAAAPADGASLEIEFVGGRLHSINGIEMSLVEAIESLETVAGAHGVGRIRLADGSRVEAPAALVLELAYGGLTAAAPIADAPPEGIVSMRLQQGRCAIVSCVARHAGVSTPALERR